MDGQKFWNCCFGLGFLESWLRAAGPMVGHLRGLHYSLISTSSDLCTSVVSLITDYHDQATFSTMPS